MAGKYLVKGVLGSGGMGVVLHAENNTISLPVAIKLLHGNLVSDESTVERFRREAQAAAGTGHQHIVEIYDMGVTDDGIPFIVMEMLEGTTLQKVLKREKVMEPTRAGRICIQVLSALSAVHAKSIVHRDLKPANVILTGRGGKYDFIKLVDFGISKFREGGKDAGGLTATGMVLGTPHYMSPEQARGDKGIDHHADIYAVGAMLYRCVSGRVPYPGKNYNQIIAQILTELPPPVRTVNPSVSAPLAAVIEKAMARNPVDRYDSAASFAADIADIVHVSISISDSHNVRYEETSTGASQISHPADSLDSSVFLSDSYVSSSQRGSVKSMSGTEDTVSESVGEGDDRNSGISGIDSSKSFIRGWMGIAGSSIRSWVKPGGNPLKVWCAAAIIFLVLIGFTLYFVRTTRKEKETVKGAGAEVSEQRVLRIGVAQYMPPPKRIELLGNLAEYLSTKLNRKVELEVPEDLGGLAQSLVNGEIDVLYISPLMYVQANEKEPAIQAVAAVRWHASSSYQGYILGRIDRKIFELKDLAGTRICWVSKNSTSGYLLPRLMLKREGLDPEGMFLEEIFARDHAKALRWLDEGRCDVAAVYNDLYHKALEQGVLKSNMRILSATGPIPQDAVAVSPKMTPDLKKRFMEALLEYDGDAYLSRHGGDEEDGITRVSSFMRVDDSHYDLVRDAMKKGVGNEGGVEAVDESNVE